MPKKDRWHEKPTAMLGGVAIFIAVIGAVLLLIPLRADSVVVISASSLLFMVGLADDFFTIKPYQKLIGQFAGAAAVIYYGLVLPWTQSPAANMLITFIWLIGITNAVNMLDNMDGLAAGISAIAAVFLAANFAMNGQYVEALSLAAFAGALGGFLLFNHNPASIFMGDCGSLFIGFFLASTALLSGHVGGRSRSVVSVLAVPVLVLCIPIFDTTFVTLMRKLAGRAASQGGRDHTSHRLVALGLTERHAVWMLYGLAASAGALSLFVSRTGFDVSVAAMTVFTIALTFLGVHLGRVRVYDEAELTAAREKPLVGFLIELSYKRRVFEVVLDFSLIVLSYYTAYALMFGSAASVSSDWQLFLRTVPVIVIIKLATFLGAGVYRGVWRYASVADALHIARAVLLGSVLSMIVIVLAFRFDGFSRTVFVLDALLLCASVTGSRFAFRLLRRLIPAPHTRMSRRVLIYGAGDGGELLLRELNNNSALQYTPVAFLDDDARKKGRVIHGLRVYDGASDLHALAQRLKADEILVATSKIADERLADIVYAAAAAQISVTRAYMAFQPVTPASVGWVLPSADLPAGVPVLVPATTAKTLIHSARPADH